MREDLALRLGSSDRELHPLWSLVSKVDDKNTGLRETNLLSLSYGQVIRRSIDGADGLRPASYETYNIIQANDIVLRMTDLQNDQRSIRTGLAGERGIITAAYVSLRPHTARVDPRYLAAALRAYDIEKVFYDMGAGVRQTLGFAELGDIPIPLPHLPTQRAIADYLDRETGEIDAMLGKLDALAGVLEKRRTVAIKVALAESGEAIPLFALGRSEDSRRVPLDAVTRGLRQGDFPYYGASGIIDRIGEFIWDHETRVLVSEDGANLLARSSPIAFVAEGQYWVNNHAHVINPVDGVDANLLARAIESLDIAHVISGSAQPKLTADAMWRLKVPFPALPEEQRRIADHLDEVTGRIDAMLAKVAQLKAVLTERRAALITDVVTGRKEVA